MDNKVVFLFLVVVATSYAAKHCYYPNVFEIKTGSTVGFTHRWRAHLLYETSEIAFDYTNTKSAEIATIFFPDGNQIHYQLIYRFDEKKLYDIDLDKRECTKTPLEGAMGHGTSPNATFAGSIYLGNDSLTIDLFESVVAEMGTHGYASDSVSSEECIPNSATFAGDVHGSSVLSTTGYFNYTSGISDPGKFFTPPDYCSQSTSKDPKEFKMRPYKMFP